MVLIELKEESSRFLCTDCDRTIFTGRNFLISKKDLPRSRLSISGSSIHYCCVCGSKYELIKSSNPAFSDQLKFKYVKVVEPEYAL